MDENPYQSPREAVAERSREPRLSAGVIGGVIALFGIAGYIFIIIVAFTFYAAPSDRPTSKQTPPNLPTK